MQFELEFVNILNFVSQINLLEKLGLPEKMFSNDINYLDIKFKMIIPSLDIVKKEQLYNLFKKQSEYTFDLGRIINEKEIDQFLLNGTRVKTWQKITNNCEYRGMIEYSPDNLQWMIDTINKNQDNVIKRDFEY